jgi:hypothetical protein
MIFTVQGLPTGAGQAKITAQTMSAGTYALAEFAALIETD